MISNSVFILQVTTYPYMRKVLIMCIVALKYFEKTGWVGVKNRDRNYKPVIYIRQSMRKDIERIYIWDDITKYTEGMNEHGVCILATAVSVKYDEKEGSKSGEDDGVYYSEDGKRIRTALFEKTPELAMKSLIDSKLPGHVIVFNSETAFLVEAGFKGHRQEDKYEYKSKKIDKKDVIVRTNHGIWLPWLGYQMTDEDGGESRKSSDSRLKKVLQDIETIKEPHKLIDSISNVDNKNPQLNPLRFDTKRNQLRTTGQLMLIPSELTLYYRPIWCQILFNFGKLDSSNTKTYFQILSARGVISPKIDGEKIIKKIKEKD